MPAPAGTDPLGEDPVDALVAECLCRLSQGDADPLAALCAANPQHEQALQGRLASLQRMGLLERIGSHGERIGRFVVLREIGQGGMGEVLLVRQEEPIRRLCALKLIGGRVGQKALARFTAEQQALGRLNHPNIAQVLEAGLTPRGQPFYVMEFVDGGPIAAYCDQNLLDLDARLRLFLQLCGAVQYAHQQGILHRDLKPGNVLVCERNGRPLVKVIDFGLAKALEEPLHEGSLLTEEGQILGTPEYMSPEQAMPTAAVVDTRSDVYALGTILYELCAGVLPFDFVQLRRQGFTALQEAVCHREPPPPSARVQALGELADVVATNAATDRAHLVRRLRGDLDWIAARALAKNRERRYPSVSELAADVQRHLDHQPVSAGPPSTLYQLRKFVRRHRAGVTIAAMTLFGLPTALVVTLGLLAQSNANLEAFDNLKVGLDLEDLARRADQDLWPALPDKADLLTKWLAQARDIVAHLPVYRAQLERLQEHGTRTDAGWQFAAPRDAYLHERLQPMITKVEEFDAPGGTIASVAARLAWANNLYQRSIVDHAAEWAKAIDTIADPTQCPPYDGRRIRPQLGLVPLGRHIQTQLYEFAVLQPGCDVPKSMGARYAIGPDTCMVLVLIPGGQARIGLDQPDPDLPRDLVVNDAEYWITKEKKHSFNVALDPYFIAKYEMTQGQWNALWGADQNPSHYRPGGEHRITLAHPVEGVSWARAAETVRRLGLQLPTGPQWELAARCNLKPPWWCGLGQHEWHGKENLLDQSAVNVTPDTGSIREEYQDGYAVHAPVDALHPNQLGLYHVLGNVREWCRDPYYRYSEAQPLGGEGRMDPYPDIKPRMSPREMRGGSYLTDWRVSRSTRRYGQPADSALSTSGLRPSRPLDK